MKKIYFTILLNISLSANYIYSTLDNQCLPYTFDTSIYLFNDTCTLPYQVNDIYYDVRFFKTFRVDTALQCVNNTNTWYGSALIFDTANPLVCATGETLNTSNCSCILDTNTTQTTTTTTITIASQLGLTEENYNYLMALSGTIFGGFLFYIVTSFLVGF